MFVIFTDDVVPPLFWCQLECSSAIIISSIPSLHNHFNSFFSKCWSRRRNASKDTEKSDPDSVSSSRRMVQDPFSVTLIDQEAGLSGPRKLSSIAVDMKPFSSQTTEVVRNRSFSTSN